MRLFVSGGNSMRKFKQALIACWLMVAAHAVAVETVLVIGTRSAGAMYEEFHRQISIVDYCDSISHSQPWCPQYQSGTGGGPGMPKLRRE